MQKNGKNSKKFVPVYTEFTNSVDMIIKAILRAEDLNIDPGATFNFEGGMFMFYSVLEVKSGIVLHLTHPQHDREQNDLIWFFREDDQMWQEVRMRTNTPEIKRFKNAALANLRRVNAIKNSELQTSN